jgi:TRAP-type C4-dicarboxylate transport system substrate-binding protein
LKEFARRLDPGGVGLFYFAGHAVEPPTGTTLLPSNWTRPGRSDHQDRGIALAEIYRAMSAPRPNKSNIVIVDACRDSVAPIDGIQSALSHRASQLPQDTLLVHATMPGSKAVDGDLGYGLLTGALLQSLSSPGIGLKDAVAEARRQVIVGTKGAQTPDVSSSLPGDLVLDPPEHVRTALAFMSQNARQPHLSSYRGISRQLSESEREGAFWDTIKNSQNPADYETYLRLYPDGVFAGDAEARLEKLSAPPPPPPPPPAQTQPRAPTAPQKPAAIGIEELSEERVAVQDVNVRAGPHKSYPSVTTAKAGTTLTVLGRTKTGWFKVRTPGDVTGYVYESLLEYVAHSKPGSPASSPSAAESEDAAAVESKRRQGSAQQFQSFPLAPVAPEAQPMAWEGPDWELRAAAVPRDGFQAFNLEQFAADVQEATLGELRISISNDPEPFASQAIMRAVANGEIPLGAVVLSEIESSTSIYDVDALPFLVRDYYDAERLWKASRSVIEASLLSNNVRVLFVVASPPNGLFLKREIQNSQDLKGMRLYAGTRVAERFASMTGMIPVQPLNEPPSELFRTNQIDAMVAGKTSGNEKYNFNDRIYYYKFAMALPKLAVIVNTGLLQTLSEESRVAIFNVAVLSRNRGWKLSVQKENEKTADLNSLGITIMKPPPVLMNILMDAANAETESWMRATGPQAKNILNSYQAARSGSR